MTSSKIFASLSLSFLGLARASTMVAVVAATSLTHSFGRTRRPSFPLASRRPRSAFTAAAIAFVAAVAAALLTLVRLAEVVVFRVVLPPVLGVREDTPVGFLPAPGRCARLFFWLPVTARNYVFRIGATRRIKRTNKSMLKGRGAWLGGDVLLCFRNSRGGGYVGEGGGARGTDIISTWREW